MNKNLKLKLSDLFNNYCFLLTEKGKIYPTYFLIKNKDIIMMDSRTGVDFNIYANFVANQAQKQNVDAIVLLAENNAIVGKQEDKDIQAIIDGRLKPGDHPDSEKYLILVYMSSTGEKEALFGKIEKDPRGIKFIRDHEWVTDIYQHKLE